MRSTPSARRGDCSGSRASMGARRRRAGSLRLTISQEELGKYWELPDRMLVGSLLS